MPTIRCNESIKEEVWLGLIVCASFLINLLLGNFSPQLVPDSGDYLQAPYWPDAFDYYRLPAYRFFIEFFSLGEKFHQPIPLIQYLFLILSTATLYFSCKKYSKSRILAYSLSAPLLFNNVVLLYLNDIHPELLAMVGVIFSLAAILLVASTNKKWPYLLYFFSCLLASFLKPSFQIMVLVWPIILTILIRISSKKSFEIKKILIVFILGSAPIFLYSALRFSYVQSFSIVSFGGVQSSGIAVAILNSDNVSKLEAKSMELASYILGKKEILESEGILAPVPMNSKGGRSFKSTALGYYDILARNYDVGIYSVTLKTKKTYETWTNFDKRLSQFTFDVVKTNLQDYGFWLFGGLSRFVGKLIVSNVELLIFFSFFVARLVYILAKGAEYYRIATDGDSFRDLVFLILLNSIFIGAILVPSIALSFPAQRYIDGAGIWIGSIFLYLFLRTFSYRKSLNILRKNEDG